MSSALEVSAASTPDGDSKRARSRTSAATAAACGAAAEVPKEVREAVAVDVLTEERGVGAVGRGDLGLGAQPGRRPAAPLRCR
jgi:hypothetical protein